MEESKKPWQSKTAIVGLVTAAAPFIPGVGDVVRSHPEESMSVLGLIFTLLRFITSGKVGF